MGKKPKTSSGGGKAQDTPKKKLTHEERRIKYTLKAREKRNHDTAQRKNQKLVCFKCRKVGHILSDCPLNDSKKSSTNEKTFSVNHKKAKMDQEASICYKCGSTHHSLKDCPDLSHAEKASGRLDYSKLQLPFATCFICNQMGHLSSQCPQNQKGIYIKGGECRQCGAKDHLFIHCPLRKKDVSLEKATDSGHSDDGEAEEVLMEQETGDYASSTKSSDTQSGNRRRVVSFPR